LKNLVKNLIRNELKSDKNKLSLINLEAFKQSNIFSEEIMVHKAFISV